MVRRLTCPVKRLEEMIEILSYVRTSAPELHLHIIGSQDNEPEGREYYERLMGLVRQNDSWISLHENLPRKELMRLVSGQRYGIHTHQEEHFGIAVAEMLKAGCIPFVPNGGGQTEIVGGDERLIYRTEEEAVEKIIPVITNPGEQISIRSYLDSRRELFSTEKFMNQIREIVGQF
jgi:glycosyltransferase involved in cell wall biosynthesis